MSGFPLHDGRGMLAICLWDPLSWLLWLSSIFVYIILCLLPIDLSIFVLPNVFGSACAEQTATSHSLPVSHSMMELKQTHHVYTTHTHIDSHRQSRAANSPNTWRKTCTDSMRTPDPTHWGLCWREQPNELKEISKSGCKRKSGNLVHF